MSGLTPEQVTPAHHAAVCATRVNPDPPADFTVFWQATVAELNAIPMDLEVRDGQWWATSLGGRRIGGTVTVPPGAFAGLRPVWIRGHGYGSLEGSTPFTVDGDPEWITLTIDTRGYGRSREDSDPGIPGWVVHQMEDRQAYILRGGVADWIRAVQVARSLDGVDPDKVVLTGGSMGGGLATLAAPWIPGLLGLVVSVPTFGAYDLRRTLVKRGSGHEVNQYWAALPPDRQGALRQSLRYFDAVNAAPLIKIPALVGLGVLDDVVPGETVAAIYHALGSEQKELLSYPCSHSVHPLNQKWDDFVAYSSAWARNLFERR
jgi:cephalosporin-C deacetylase